MLLTALSGVLAKADPPPTARAEIGQLTIRYSPQIWRAEDIGDTLRMHCLLERCAGLRFDMTVNWRREGHCDEREADAKAKELWPQITRRGTNIMKAGRFAFVVTDSYESDDLLGRKGMFACMTRLGLQYEVRSDLYKQEGSWDASGWLRKLAFNFEAPNPSQNLDIGKMELSFPVERWTETPMTIGRASILGCLPPACDDWQSTVFVYVSPGEAECKAPYPDPNSEYYSLRESELLAGQDGKQRFSIFNYWNGCRNWTPPHVLACTAHQGATYWFATPPGLGCHDYREIPDETFEGLLNGVRMRQ